MTGEKVSLTSYCPCFIVLYKLPLTECSQRDTLGIEIGVEYCPYGWVPGNSRIGRIGCSALWPAVAGYGGFYCPPMSMKEPASLALRQKQAQQVLFRCLPRARNRTEHPPGRRNMSACSVPLTTLGNGHFFALCGNKISQPQTGNGQASRLMRGSLACSARVGHMIEE